jgi:hypothetical protein
MQITKIVASSIARPARPRSGFLQVVTILIGMALAGANPVLAQQKLAPFEWQHSFASPGKSLTVKVLQTMREPPHGMVMISIKSSGFSDAAGVLVLWQKRSGQYYRFEPGIGAEGTVQIIPGVESMILGGHLRGESFDIALVDETTNERAHAKVTPFPITAQGSGDCAASAEIQTPSGLLWQVFLDGFGAGESVTITSVSKKETLTNTVVASETGGISFPVIFPKRSKGTARVTAEGALGCNVTLEYAIGKTARKAK